MIAKTAPSVSYCMWLKRILDTHAAQAWDAELTDAREREDEELNELWTEIDDLQKQRLWGLSSDLNALRDREAWVESDWPPLSQEEHRRALSESFLRKDWDKLLEYLRRPPRFLSDDRIDYMRGRAWMELGHPEVAVLFFDNAARREPGNSAYRVLALECLKAMRDWPEIVARCEAYLDDPAVPARLLLRAGDVLFAYADQTGDRASYQFALDAVEKGFCRMDQPGQQEALPSVVAAAYATRAFCLARLGRAQEAVQVLDEAVARFPENATLLAARGVVKQEWEGAGALDDFRQAVDRGSPILWPYVALAREALLAGRNEEAAYLCRRGLASPQSNGAAWGARAALLQLLAIALLRQHQPAEAVRGAFQAAEELDPLSEEIRTNRQRYERYAANPDAGEPQWQLTPGGTEAALGEICAQLQPVA